MAINQGRETHALWVISTKWAFVLGDESLLHMLSQYILLCEIKQISSQDKKVGTFTFWASKRSSRPTWSVMRCALLLSLVWLCDYMDCARRPMWSPPDTPLSLGILRQEYCSGFPCLPPTQELNPGLLHCRWILFHLSHHGLGERIYLLHRVPPVDSGLEYPSCCFT